MKTDGIWQSFFETGDPVCYLLAKKAEQRPNTGKNRQKGTGEKPRPSD